MRIIELEKNELECLRWHLGLLIETKNKNDSTMKALYNKLFGQDRIKTGENND